MGEILLMKTTKLLLGFICYLGTGIVAVDEVMQGAVKEAINVSPAAQQIILWLLIVFWVIKIAWFMYDKFYLERQERNLEMDKTREEIIDLKESHK